jgi:hypothetical protein
MSSFLFSAVSETIPPQIIHWRSSHSCCSYKLSRQNQYKNLSQRSSSSTFLLRLWAWYHFMKRPEVRFKLVPDINYVRTNTAIIQELCCIPWEMNKKEAKLIILCHIHLTSNICDWILLFHTRKHHSRLLLPCLWESVSHHNCRSASTVLL